MRLSAFETYCIYVAVKNHLTTQSYDYHKYNGKINVTKEAFDTRRDKYQFHKLSRLYSDDQMLDFLVANSLRSISWTGELVEDTAKTAYLQFIKRKQSFTYIFTNEVQKLFDSVDKPSDIFKRGESSYPRIIDAYLANEIGPDTLTVLNVFFDFVPRFDRELGKKDVLWKPIRLIALKLVSFLDYDHQRIKSILKDIINI